MAEMTERVTFTLSPDLRTAMADSAWKSRKVVSEWLREAIESKLAQEAA